MNQNRYLNKEAIERAQRYLDEGGDVLAVLALTFAAELREEYRGEDGGTISSGSRSTWRARSTSER